jgi:N12 class adenine-specific DNA methylase
MNVIQESEKMRPVESFCKKDFVREEWNAQEFTAELRKTKSKLRKRVLYYSFFLKSFPNY